MVGSDEKLCSVKAVTHSEASSTGTILNHYGEKIRLRKIRRVAYREFFFFVRWKVQVDKWNDATAKNKAYKFLRDKLNVGTLSIARLDYETCVTVIDILTAETRREILYAE